MSNKYYRLAKCGLVPSNLLDKGTKAAFELTFADPAERFKLFQQLIDLRMLLAQHGIKSKGDLEASLRSPD